MRGLTLIATAVAMSVAGCIDWLEVDDGPEAEYQLPVGEPLVLPSEPALLDAPGPLVPRTPGLRVPLAGYWTRVRLDALDLLLPMSWVSLTSAKGPNGEQALFRLEAAMGQGDDLTLGVSSVVGFRAVIPIDLPAGTDLGVVRDGFELPDRALSNATMALRTSAQDVWLITPTRLRFVRVAPGIITGSLEGEARRGAKGQRVRKFAAAFLALRAPDGVDAAPAEFEPPPGAGDPGP